LSIHLPTLALVLVMLVVQSALALLFLAFGHPNERGIKHAGFAILTLAAGVALTLLLRERIPAALAVGLGNALLLGGACYLLISVRLFYGRRVNFWYPAIAGSLVCIAFLRMVALKDNIQARTILASLLLGLVSLAIAREFARKTREEVWAGPRWLCVTAFLLFGLAALGRALMFQWSSAGAGPTDLVSANLLMIGAALGLMGFMGLGLALVLAQRLEARQQRFAQSDLLTGLLNRRGFEAYAIRVLARARVKGQFTSLLLLDVDHFKRINDTYGHGAGDLVLESLGDLLHQQLRERDGAGRWGGEELVVLLPETHQSFAHPVAERIRGAVEAMEIIWEGKTIPVTASFGVASADEADSDLATLFQLADARLYRAKAEGRNRVVAG
jgi:diguanylate cyclase (GGDEF)-like protein